MTFQAKHKSLRTIVVAPETLSDGSKVWNVTLNAPRFEIEGKEYSDGSQTFHARDAEHAQDLCTGLRDLIHRHTNEQVETAWLF